MMLPAIVDTTSIKDGRLKQKGGPGACAEKIRNFATIDICSQIAFWAWTEFGNPKFPCPKSPVTSLSPYKSTIQMKKCFV